MLLGESVTHLGIDRRVSGHSLRAARLPGAIGSHENWGRQLVDHLARG
jgi:hypothetical protein